MNVNLNNIEGLAVLVILWGIFVTVFWMVVGWRAMRAHERIAHKISTPARRRHDAM